MAQSASVVTRPPRWVTGLAIVCVAAGCGRGATDEAIVGHPRPSGVTGVTVVAEPLTVEVAEGSPRSPSSLTRVSADRPTERASADRVCGTLTRSPRVPQLTDLRRHAP